MIFPVTFSIDGLNLPIHQITDIISVAIGLVYYIYLRKKSKDFLNEDMRWNLIIGGGIGAIVGSHLLAALENPQMFFNAPSILYYIYGKTIVGGLIGAIIGVETTKYFAKEKKPTGDLFVFPLILAMIIGRIGCFLTGVSDRTVGLPSSLPWAIIQGDGIPRHPTSLYEIAFLGILAIFLMRKKKKYPQGKLFKTFIISYMIFRFAIEFIKPISPLFLGLSAIQIASGLMACWYIIKLTKKQNGTRNKTAPIS